MTLTSIFCQIQFFGVIVPRTHETGQRNTIMIHLNQSSKKNSLTQFCDSVLFIERYKLNVFSQHIGKKQMIIWIAQIHRNWNADQLSVLITSWNIT